MNDTFMKEKPVLPLLLSMALPMVLSMLVNSLYNIVDSFFVARISEDAMTALSLVYPVQNLINAVGIGFGIGINAVIALHLGAQEQRAADQVATQGLLMAAVHSVLMTVGSLAVMPSFCGCSPHLRPSKPWACSIPRLRLPLRLLSSSASRLKSSFRPSAACR